MEYLQVDIREKGSAFYKMTNQEGLVMFGKVQYLQIQRPNVLVYLQQFCDDLGQICRPAFAPTWPETMKTVVEFNPEDEQATRITITWEVQGQATVEEINTFTSARAGMTMGWSGSLDKLEDVLVAAAKSK